MRTSVWLAIGVLWTSTLQSDPRPEFIGLESLRNSRVGQFDVQGIRLGMDIDSAASLLTSKGFRRRENQDFFSTHDQTSSRQIRLTRAVAQGRDVVAQIHYEQGFFQPVAAQELRDQVVARYGAPSSEEPWGAEIRLAYHDAAEPAGAIQGKAKIACQDEITKARKVPQLNILTTAMMATDPGRWVTEGDARVREHCPGALALYHGAVKANYAPTLVITVGSQVKLHLSSRAVIDAAVHEFQIKQREAHKTAPTPKVDL